MTVVAGQLRVSAEMNNQSHHQHGSGRVRREGGRGGGMSMIG